MVEKRFDWTNVVTWSHDVLRLPLAAPPYDSLLLEKFQSNRIPYYDYYSVLRLAGEKLQSTT